MDILVTVEEIIIDDSHIYVAYPEDVIYDESVGEGKSSEEAVRDLAECFGSMLYASDGMLMQVEVRQEG